MILTGGNRVLVEKLVTVPLCSPQIARGLTWHRIRASAETAGVYIYIYMCVCVCVCVCVYYIHTHIHTDTCTNSIPTSQGTQPMGVNLV